MQKVIMDVDTGIDDALAILLAVKSRQFDLLGITTTSGNISLEQATINTKKVLKLLGAEETVKVIKGANGPLLRSPSYETSVHGEDGLGGALQDMEVTAPSQGFAADFIIEQAQQYQGEITLILLAPLTNMALAIKKQPEITKWVKELVIMGGVVNGIGNISPVAEYNMFIDPEAAKIVLHSGIPITMVGLDVTRKALLTESHIGQLRDTEVGNFVETSTRHYINRYVQVHGIKACALHDPLAVGVALDKNLVRTRKLFVDVETKSELCDGQTVCDFQNRLNREPNVNVCLEVDQEKFLDMFVEYLKK